MKKVLVIIGMILCTLCFVSCASKVKKIEMKMSFDSGTGTEIVDSKDIKEIKKNDNESRIWIIRWWCCTRDYK